MSEAATKPPAKAIFGHCPSCRGGMVWARRWSGGGWLWAGECKGCGSWVTLSCRPAAARATG